MNIIQRCPRIIFYMCVFYFILFSVILMLHKYGHWDLLSYQNRRKLERFVPTYVSSRRGPPVRIITFMTQGLKPSWKVAKGEMIRYLRVPVKDKKLSHLKRKDMVTLRQHMIDIRAAIPPVYLDRKSLSLKEILPKMKPDIQAKINKWLELTKGSPLFRMWQFKYYLYNLEVLLTKKDATKQWTLKCDNCFRNDFKTIIEPRNACAGDNDIELVVIVTAVPKSVKSRKIIRDTWGGWSKNNTSNIRLIFLFGAGWSEKESQILANESAIYGDILQEDYHDSYYNLTQKVISGFKWVSRACPRAGFIMRTADDTFVDLLEVLDLLQKHGRHPRMQDYQVGRCLYHIKPHRCPDFKVYTSTEDYDDDLYPPYAFGTTFLTSMKLAKEIVEHSRNITFMPLEDVYFGLVLRDIGTGCTDVHPFPGSTNDVSDEQKNKLFYSLRMRP